MKTHLWNPYWHSYHKIRGVTTCGSDINPSTRGTSGKYLQQTSTCCAGSANRCNANNVQENQQPDNYQIRSLMDDSLNKPKLTPKKLKIKFPISVKKPATLPRKITISTRTRRVDSLRSSSDCITKCKLKARYDCCKHNICKGRPGGLPSRRYMSSTKSSRAKEIKERRRKEKSAVYVPLQSMEVSRCEDGHDPGVDPTKSILPADAATCSRQSFEQRSHVLSKFQNASVTPKNKRSEVGGKYHQSNLQHGNLSRGKSKQQKRVRISETVCYSKEEESHEFRENVLRVPGVGIAQNSMFSHISGYFSSYNEQRENSKLYPSYPILGREMIRKLSTKLSEATNSLQNTGDGVRVSDLMDNRVNDSLDLNLGVVRSNFNSNDLKNKKETWFKTNNIACSEKKTKTEYYLKDKVSYLGSINHETQIAVQPINGANLADKSASSESLDTISTVETTIPRVSDHLVTGAEIKLQSVGRSSLQQTDELHFFSQPSSPTANSFNQQSSPTANSFSQSSSPTTHSISQSSSTETSFLESDGCENTISTNSDCDVPPKRERLKIKDLSESIESLAEVGLQQIYINLNVFLLI